MSVSESGFSTTIPPRSSRTHFARARERSCLLMLSRDTPIIRLISCWVTRIVRGKGPSASSAMTQHQFGHAYPQIEKHHVFNLFARLAQASAQDLDQFDSDFRLLV